MLILNLNLSESQKGEISQNVQISLNIIFFTIQNLKKCLYFEVRYFYFKRFDFSLDLYTHNYNGIKHFLHFKQTSNKMLESY